jgi:hypothetical protein
MKKHQSRALLAGILLLGGLAAAQDPAPIDSASALADDGSGDSSSRAPATKGDIDGLSGQILNVDNFYSRALQFNVPAVNRPLTIAGNVSDRWTYYQDSLQAHNSFTVPNVSLSFSGILFKDYEDSKNLTYAFAFSSTNGAAPTLTDGYLAYSFISAADLANPSLAVSVGQQKKVFGQEPQSTPETQPSIVGSAYLSAKNGFSDLSARDIGIVVKGDLLPTVDYGYNYRAPLVSYSVSVFNGAGANVASDNNRNKEIGARIVLAPPVDYYNPLRGLTVGFSADYSRQPTFLSFTDTTGLKKTVVSAETLFTVKTTTTGDTVNADRLRYGFDVSYIRTPVNFTVEGVYGRIDTANSVGSKTGSQVENVVARKYWGGAATIFLNIGEQFLKGYVQQSRADDWWPITFQPFFRAEYFDPNSKGYDDEQIVITPGANLFFARTTKVQLNYRWTKTLGHPARDHQLLAQFAYSF